MKIILEDPKLNLYDKVDETKEIIGLEIIERELYSSLGDSSGIIREMCTHMINSGGKRIRPLLVLYSGLAFSGISNDLINAAVAAELIHMATLAHDDIIDNSELRRNRPSLNKVWSNQFGVLCGDFLFSKAFGMLSRNKLLKNLDFMVEAIDNMCNGEILQANNRFNVTTDLNSYYEQIAKKTAIFMECCCKSGACIGDANEPQMRAIGGYGLNLGLAFQIMDDILDFCGNTMTMGKPKGEDFRQGIITMPAILLLTNEKYSSQVNGIISKREYSEQDFGSIVELLYSSGAVDKSHKKAVFHIDAAQNCLEPLPETPYRDCLYHLAEKLKFRNY